MPALRADGAAAPSRLVFLLLRVGLIWGVLHFAVWPRLQPSWSRAVTATADALVGAVESGRRVTRLAASGGFIHAYSDTRPGDEPAATWDAATLHFNASFLLAVIAVWPMPGWRRRAAALCVGASALFALHALSLAVMSEHLYAVTLARISARYYSSLERWLHQFLFDTVTVRAIALVPAFAVAILFLRFGLDGRPLLGSASSTGRAAPRRHLTALLGAAILVSAGACLAHHPRVAARQAEADTALGWALLEAGSLPGAKTAFDAALARRQDLAAAHEGLGRILLSQERWPDAVGRFRHALFLGPESASAGVSLGNALARAGDREAALEAWAAVLAQQPGHREALLNRAATLRGLARGPEADEDLRTLLSHHPGDPRALMALAASLMAAGSGCEALPYLRDLSGAPGAVLPGDQKRLVTTSVTDLETRCPAIEGPEATRSRP